MTELVLNKQRNKLLLVLVVVAILACILITSAVFWSWNQQEATNINLDTYRQVPSENFFIGSSENQRTQVTLFFSSWDNIRFTEIKKIEFYTEVIPYLIDLARSGEIGLKLSLYETLESSYAQGKPIRILTCAAKYDHTFEVLQHLLKISTTSYEGYPVFNMFRDLSAEDFNNPELKDLNIEALLDCLENSASQNTLYAPFSTDETLQFSFNGHSYDTEKTMVLRKDNDPATDIYEISREDLENWLR